MDPNRLMTKTLETASWGEGVARILAAALQAVDPKRLSRELSSGLGTSSRSPAWRILWNATAVFTWWAPAKQGSRWQPLPRQSWGNL